MTETFSCITEAAAEQREMEASAEQSSAELDATFSSS